MIEHGHPEWRQHYVGWRQLLDSLEGGEAYRNAQYGVDRRGLPARNLFRHKREYPDPLRFANSANYLGTSGLILSPSAMDALGGVGMLPGQLGADPATVADDDDYETRRARTPVPEFVAEAVELHLSKLFSREIGRDTGDAPGLPELEAWWADVDGRGTSIDDWMRQTVAPLLAVLGCLDVCVDHPRAPEGQAIGTRADELRLGLNRCVASYILPTNLVWWRLDAAGRYRECLVREFVDPCDRVDYDKSGKRIDPDGDGDTSRGWMRDYARYRLWRPDESALFAHGGELIRRTPHAFGRVPVTRLIDIPSHKTPHIGRSRYGYIAQAQRAYYNIDSELTLNGTLQSSPLLCVPEEFLRADGTLAIGPGYALPMKKDVNKGGYQAPEFISPPSDPSNSLRQNKSDLIELKDRRACLARPLAVRSGGGGSGGKGSAVADPQAAAAKQLDQIEGHDLLNSLAQSFAKAERQVAEYVLLVCRDGVVDPADLEKITINYPSKFDLYAAGDLITNLTNLQKCLALVGQAPMVEREVLKSVVRQILPGLDDEDYAKFDAELDELALEKAKIKEQQSEIGAPGYDSEDDALEGDGTDEAAAGEDPYGVSGSTAVTPGAMTTA